jgi:hypothetical protein
VGFCGNTSILPFPVKSPSEEATQNPDHTEPDDAVWNMAQEHLKKIPYRISHYTSKNPKLYFKNLGLNVVKLFTHSEEYYQENNDIPIKIYNTFQYCLNKT